MTATRPSFYPYWTDGNPSKVVQPPGAVANEGWDIAEAPPNVYMNWLQWITGLWIAYFDAALTTGEPDQVIRLLDGGFWSYVNSSGVMTWSADAFLAICGVPDSNNRIPAGNVTINDGDIAYVTINPPAIIQGTSQSGNNVLINVNFTSLVTTGMSITGPGIPGGTTVTGVGVDTISMSASATGNNTNATYVVGATNNLTVTATPSSTFLATLSTIIIARREGEKIYLGVNTGQMILRDHESKPLLGSGYFTAYDAVAGENLTAGQLVYISIGNPTDPGRTAGRIYKLDVSAANQSFRGNFAGAVISNVSTAGTVTVVYNGFYNYGSLTAGDIYYADPSTPGGITSTAPTSAGEKILPVGTATDANLLLLSAVSGSGSAVNTFPLFKTDTYGPGIDGQTTFACTSSPLNQEAITPYINGILVLQDEFILSGNDVVLNTAISSSTDKISIRYLLAQQSYLTQKQQTTTNSGDNINYTFTFQPNSLDETSVYIDGAWQDPADVTNGWTLTIGVGTGTITFNTANSSTQKVGVVSTVTAVA